MQTTFDIGTHTRATDLGAIPPKDPALAAWLSGGSNSPPCVSVTEDTALTLSAVWAAVRRISGAVACSPLRVHEVTEKGLTPAPDHPLNRLFTQSPCDECTPSVFMEAMMLHVLLRGNAYAEIQRTQGGDVHALWLLPSNRVQPVRQPNSLKYDVQLTGESGATLRSADVIHIPGLGFDGLKGLSVIQHARTSLGLALAAEEYGARWFSGDGRPAGVLEHPGQVTEQQHERLRDSWAKVHSGVSRSHRIAILEEGMKFGTIGSTPEESQFLESRQFSIAEVGRWFDIPPHMIGDLSHATFSNIVHHSLEFVRYTLRPWFRRWTEELGRKLLRPPYVWQFDPRDLVRGDNQTEFSTAANARTQGIATLNEARAMVHLPPVDEQFADTFTQPLNTGAPDGTETLEDGDQSD